MNTGDIIKELRKKNNLTQEELGTKLGIKKSAIRKYEKGEVENIKKSNIIKLAKIFNVTPSYLMGWEDDSEDNEKVETIPTTVLTYFDNICVNCSSPIISECSDIEVQEASISNNILGKYANNSNLVAIKSRGDSMDEIIPEGSVIIIQKLLPFENVQTGDIVMYSFEDCWSIKEFIKKDDCVIFRPHSTNKRHKDNVYTFEDMENGMEVPKIIGKVVFYGVSL